MSKKHEWLFQDPRGLCLLELLGLVNKLFMLGEIGAQFLKLRDYIRIGAPEPRRAHFPNTLSQRAEHALIGGSCFLCFVCPPAHFGHTSKLSVMIFFGEELFFVGRHNQTCLLWGSPRFCVQCRRPQGLGFKVFRFYGFQVRHTGRGFHLVVFALDLRLLTFPPTRGRLKEKRKHEKQSRRGFTQPESPNVHI